MASKRRRTKFDPQERYGERDEPSRARGKRGGEAPAGEIDLHGCTLEAAIRRLSEGLARFRAARKSPVLVITGKGYGSPGGRPVLSPGIERWLRGPEALALGVAGHRKLRDGGSFEVTIKRK